MKIVLATGGSGGHIFPALKVADQLRRMGHAAILVGVFGEASRKIREQGFSYFNLSAKGFSFSSVVGFLKSFFYMLKALEESFQILKNLKPDCVCGFGGYGAFPVLGAAFLLRCPTMIHEQNVVPGRANRILSLGVGKIAITFKESQRYFPSLRTVWTGCPTHAQQSPLAKKDLLSQFGLDENKLTILVLGGSQGSRRINAEFVEAMPLLKKHLDFQVIHISGRNDYTKLRDFYAHGAVPFSLFDFLEDIGSAYQAADLAVARAGALTVLEIVQFQLPAILIPYPFAGGHQKDNARILSEISRAKIIEEKDLNPQVLAEEIHDLWAGRFNRPEISPRVKGIVTLKADVRLAQEIVSLIK